VRLVPAAVTCWAVTAAAIVWPVGRILAGGFVALAVLTVLLRRRAGSAVGAVLAICVVGAGFSWAAALRSAHIDNHPISKAFGHTVTVVLTPTENPRRVAGGRVLFAADLSRVEDSDMPCRVTVFASSADFDSTAVGRPVRTRARISEPGRRDLTAATLTTTGRPVAGTAPLGYRIAAQVRQRLAHAAGAVLPPSQAALLPALVLGDTAAVPAEVDGQFRTAGLTHLTAVSGANVTIICGAVLLAARMVGPRAAVLLAGAVLAGFVVVVTPTASVLRAAVMGAITLLAIVTSRRRQAIPALACSVIVLMVTTPALAVDIGFALSVSATAALVLIAPIWSRVLTARHWPKPLADALAVSAAAQLVTAPLIAAISGTFSVVSVGANLLVAPVIAPITVLGTGAAVLTGCWPGAAHLLIRFTGPELWWLLAVARCAAGLPGATVPVPEGFGGVLTLTLLPLIVFVLWRPRQGRKVVVVMAVGVGAVLLSWALATWVGGRPAPLSARHDTIVA